MLRDNKSYINSALRREGRLLAIAKEPNLALLVQKSVRDSERFI
jgi:hypothetical protein